MFATRNVGVGYCFQLTQLNSSLFETYNRRINENEKQQVASEVVNLSMLAMIATKGPFISTQLNSTSN